MDRFVRLCAVSELAPGEARRFTVGKEPVALARVGEEFYAIGDVCSHGNFSLSEGEVDSYECTLECPKHGSLFDLQTGEPLTLPATAAVALYEVKVRDGEVFAAPVGRP